MQDLLYLALQKSLSEKLAGLDRLLELAEKHREALIHQDIDGLVGINEAQTVELSTLDKAQKASARILGRFAQSLGSEAALPSLTDIIPSLPDHQRQGLLEVSGQLQEKASALAWASEVNAGLSANALELIRVSLGSISASIGESRGQTDGPASLVLDQKA